MEQALRQELHVKHFPLQTAGTPLPGQKDSSNTTYSTALRAEESAPHPNPFSPFASKIDWEVARWAKCHGIGSNAMTDLLSIEGFVDQLGLSYSNSRELHAIIDKEIPAERPRFECRKIRVEGITVELYLRDAMECVRALYGDPQFAPHLIYAPEQHFLDEEQTDRVWHDMHTGNWWWMAQVFLESCKPGATIVPIILSSDKTQIASFRGKSAYPLYMTIGNIPKDIRRKPSQKAYVLLGYLPTDKLEEIRNQAKRRRLILNIFHASLREILRPLKVPGSQGEEMASGDGICRRIHPILAAYACDYQEQVVVTGALSGDCPTCEVPHKQLGDLDVPIEFRHLAHIRDILAIADSSPRNYLQACQAARIKPIYRPFWDDLPLADIFLSITPDVLHQLYQGVLKHLVAWVKSAYSPAELDARCRVLPPNHHVRAFFKGITSLTKLTGREHADIAHILLGLVANLPLPNNLSPLRIVTSVRALLDFLYLAQYPIHNKTTLDAMDLSMRRFHENKYIFEELDIRQDWNFPKLHVVQCHYRFLIERFGTTDNFNTEFFERLHIDVAKDAADATNWKDELPQMTLWLERQEKIVRHDRFIQWRLAGCPPILSTHNQPVPPPLQPLKMTKHPSLRGVTILALQEKYGAVDFVPALCHFIAFYNHTGLSHAALRREAARIQLPFIRLPVYHRARFWRPDFSHFRSNMESYDVIHVRPARENYRGEVLAPRFDTALVNTGRGGIVGVQGYRVAQVKVIFTLPEAAIPFLFNTRQPPTYLAYIEWFTPFRDIDAATGLYKVSRSFKDGRRAAAVVPLINIHCSVHLFPQFGPQVNSDWSSDNVLDLCNRFYVNCFSDRHAYGTLV
ncbi:hypothetical protein K474DRAFT_1726506 [Panus rudis PR-1116 ss-1]|nr:hypothetical protein K474DRAFT_1726506 [Panus rudis PR-1116 ss-1]